MQRDDSMGSDPHVLAKCDHYAREAWPSKTLAEVEAEALPRLSDDERWMLFAINSGMRR